ncbi:MAG: C40 family peptidase [Clostridiaceae bacterium]|nr:C40 family peptidase [Clostridiaceae bacterium]
MDKIKEKPKAASSVREKIKAAPKELVHRGLENSADRLRTQLRDTAQRGQRDEYGGDRIEDTAAGGVRRVGHIMGKTAHGRKQAGSVASHSAPENDMDTDKAGNGIKTKDVYVRQQAETQITGMEPEHAQGRQAFIRERGRQTAQKSAQARMERRKQDTGSMSAGSTVAEYWNDDRGQPVASPRRSRSLAMRQVGRQDTSAPVVKEAERVKQVLRTKPVDKAGRQAIKTVDRAGSLPAGASQAMSRAAAQRAKTMRAAQQATRYQQAAKAAGNAAGRALHNAVKALRAIYAAARSMAAAAAAGSSVVLALLILICLFGLLVASPFGILFTTEPTGEGTVALSTAIAQINQEYTEKLDALQNGDYDQIIINGSPPDWKEVVAVFAVKTAGTNDGVDVVTLDEDRVERMRNVFWDMVSLDAEVETTGQEGEESKTILTITITAKTVDEMREFYSFTDQQNNMLDELLDNLELIGGAIGNLDVTDVGAQELLAALPSNLSAERRAVVEAACTLVGKVNYFWGGKSLTIGWNPLWGTTMRVTAAGSPTTGTYRPYGLDCSGFVDWAFYNASAGSYIMGHGGGTYSQHAYCTPIAWSEAQPGDLVFYPGDSHVGIVGGRDENGNLLIIHCASGYNNVVITGLEGFTSIGRPEYFTK